VTCVQDYDRRRSDADRYGSSSRSWKDSDDGFSGEPAECELGRSGRHVHSAAGHRHHAHCDRSHRGHYHDDGDLNDVRVSWDGSSHYATHDERQTPSVDYEQQLRRHGWRMEVHGDPLHLKCVICMSQ